jgi:hypothetical protein
MCFQNLFAEPKHFYAEVFSSAEPSFETPILNKGKNEQKSVKNEQKTKK